MSSNITLCRGLECTSFPCSHFLGSLYLLLVYSHRVGRSHLPWPPSIPCHGQAQFQLSRRAGEQVRCSLPARCIPAAGRGRGAASSGATSQPAPRHRRFVPRPGVSSGSSAGTDLVALNGICSTDPAKSYGGFPCSSRSLCPVLNSIFLMVLLC